MAAPWIKMRNNLWDDPRVSRICDESGASEGPVIGALYWLWSVGDEHSEDGFLPGLTRAGLDRKVQLPGFASALLVVGWLQEAERGLSIVRFDEHNGASAKRRWLDAIRKGASRIVSASDADTMRTQSGVVRTNCAPDIEREKEERIQGLRPSSEICFANSEAEESRATARQAEGAIEESLVVFATVAGRTSHAKTWGLTAQHVAELSEAFPDLDILAEARRALLWTKAKPGRRKTAAGMSKFLLGWMSRANDDGAGRKPAPAGVGRIEKPTLRERIDTLNFPDSPTEDA